MALRTLQARLLATAMDVFKAESPDVGPLCGALLASAALQLLPLVLASSTHISRPVDGLTRMTPRLVGPTCRTFCVTASSIAHVAVA